jgi:hypothetical protein
MANTTNIRGPYPSESITSGAQTYFVDERLGPGTQIGRKVMLIWQNGHIMLATCTCTPKASLSLPCSHIQSILNYIGITTSVAYTPRQISARARKSSLVPKPSPPSVSATTSISISTKPKKPEVILNNDTSALPDFITDLSQIKFVIRAVQDEIEEIQNSPNVKQILITNGKLIGSLGESFRYKFDMSDDFRSPPDIPIELHIGAEDIIVSGSILRCEPDSFIEIALDQFHGKNILQARLISRLDFIWKAAEKRLSSLGEGQNLDIFKFALNPRSETVYEVSVGEDWGEYPPNDEQRIALETSLRQKVSFVYGPPGTGKSQTIGWLGKELIRRGEKVIITSHTNIAVDNALQKVCETKEGRGLRDSGDIIRLGEPINTGLNDLRLPQIIERKSAGLKQKLNLLNQDLRVGEERRHSYVEEIGILNKYQHTHQEQEKLSGLIRSTDKVISDAGRVAKRKYEELIKIRHLISSTNLFDILLWPIRKIQENQVESDFTKYRTYITGRESYKQKVLEKLAAIEEELRNNNIPLEFSEFENILANLEKQKLDLSSSLEKLKEDIKSIQDHLDEIAKNVVSQAKIIGLTLSKLCIDPSVSKLQCENVIIDELSTAPFPLVLVALIAPIKRAIFLGDPKQLPPISVSKTEYSHKYLQRDTYEIIEQHKNVRCELTEQWRMPVSIVEFVNLALYDGKLRTPPKFEKERNEDIFEGGKSPFRNYPFKDHQVIFIDTSSINPWCGYDANKSRYNLYSAHIIAEIIAQEVEEKPEWANSKEDEKKKIGVICPYRAQKQLLKKLSHSRLEMEGKSELIEKYIDFHTVDSFQGEQRDVVILDLTAGQPSSPGIRLSEKVESEIAGNRSVSKVRRLLNVAITRTKYQLVIVGNKNYFEREFKNDKDEYVLDIIQRASRGKGKYHVSIDGEDLLRGQRKTISGYSLFLSESDFYAYVKRDFDSATSSVVIVSPFITQNRVKDLIPHITDMLKRHVKVWIVTRPVEDADFGVGALKTLEQLGCIVKQRKRTHEKIVIIDNKVAYYGSLNVLSHKDTKEVMHRIQGEQITQLIQQFIDVIGYASKTNIQQPQKLVTAYLTREECEGKLKHIRWTIATQRHIPFYAVLYNQTIDELLNRSPQTEEALYELLDECGEKQMKHLGPFLDEILSILQRYKR